MINKNNDKNKVRTDKRFSVVIFTCFALFIGAVVLAIGSTATMSVYAVTTQTLPTCVDPTGHNLPCIMVISTLPPPPNPLQCQETSGQILACSYATQYLSNGEQVVVITLYVPANFVFSSPDVIKVIVHETTTTSTTGGGTGGSKTLPHQLSVAIAVAKNPIIRGNIQTIIVGVSDDTDKSKKIGGADVNGEVTYVTGHQEPLTGVTNSQGIYSHHWRIGGNATPGKFKIDAQASAGGKSGSAKTAFTVIPKTNTTISPINMTKGNMTVAASGGKGTGPTCINNCTTGTLTPVDCKMNPNDPSCVKSFAPPPATTTKTCPGGSTPDSSGNCPTTKSPTISSPNTSSPPTTNNNPTPPSTNNLPPSGGSSNSNSGGGGNGNNNNGGGGGSSSSGTSSPSH
ncbi:MAG: hypothetical protein DLM72_14205 [Candidatus Nitrosopolaris wilkensis]|nr:MAG: hypothetical protein DLM72_14205 [Candidatus Nitrosopolaris wilkensis]